jgi:hypothetical protein
MLDDRLTDALRKAATIARIAPYIEGDLLPLVEWARTLKALEPRLIAEDLVDVAEASKAERHRVDAKKRVALLSHSSKDKPFIRQLAADLTANGIDVWLFLDRDKCFIRCFALGNKGIEWRRPRLSAPTNWPNSMP